MDELTDGHVTLRPWKPWDAAWYVTQALDPDIQAQTTERPDLTVDEVRAAIERLHLRDDAVGYAICEAWTGALLGNLAFGLSEDHSRGAVSYWIARSARGLGYATAAVKLISEWAFNTYAIDEVQLWVRAGNKASARVAEKAGFRRAPDRDSPREVRGETWQTEYWVRPRF